MEPITKERPADSPAAVGPITPRRRTAVVPHRPETFYTPRNLDYLTLQSLQRLTGHHKLQWPAVIVKELVDNAIDAQEETGTTPVVRVTVTDDTIEVADGGEGVDGKLIASVVNFDMRGSSREAYVGPTRGAQGNALKTIIAMPFVLHGEIGVVEIESRGVLYRVSVAVDRIANHPKVAIERDPSPVKVGTIVRVRWPHLACSILSNGHEAISQLLQEFATWNPHLHLTAEVGDAEPKTWGPTSREWKRFRPGDHSPHWYDLDRLRRLVTAMLNADRETGRERPIRELIASFNGLSSTVRQKEVLAELGLARAPLSTLMNAAGDDVDPEMIERLLRAMQAVSKPPKAEALGIVGADHLKARLPLGKAGASMFNYRRRIDADPASPKVAETFFAYVPDLQWRYLSIGLNNSPALAGVGAFDDLGHRSLSGILGKRHSDESEPICFGLHIIAAKLTFTDTGKSKVKLQDEQQ